jgi:putative heme-binding domain-containing protein
MNESARGTRRACARFLMTAVVAAVHFVAVHLAAVPTALAQRDLKDIPPPDPEIERASFQVADGFEVNLYAADPLLAKPIQMNFDAAGRLWIASSEIYPHILPGQQANDKIVVLEDADGDGRAEKASVFADGLLIPTGVEPGDGGAYVANSTELVHLADRDGDGRADTRRVMLSGFGTEDTHHILHTLRWGPDGMLYFNQSIYIHSHIETPYGVRRLGGGGIWQFRPETMQLEVFNRGLVNPWGHHFDRWGQSFETDGAGGEGINYIFPGSTFTTSPGAKRILKGLNPGSPKYCGLEIVSGRHLPDDWQGNLITNDFRAHRVCRFVVAEDESGFSAREQTELIKTSHVAFRPIDVKMGPDGAIYIADWYNPIIQHGEVDFRDPRRDHTHGRIWRVTAKGRPLVERPRLVGATTAALLEALKAPEDWTRQHAKRQLKERGASVLPELAAWVRGLDPADPNFEHHRLEALWTYQSLDVVRPDLLAQLLRSTDHRVRAAATRVVYHWHARLPNPLELLAVQVADDHPRVRLEAVRALSQIASPVAATLALGALDRPLDENLDFALWLTCRELAPVWLGELQAGRLDFGGNVRRLEFALRAVEDPAAVEPLVRLLQQGKVPREREESVLSLIAELGSPAEMGLVFQMAVIDKAASTSRQAVLLKALARATRERKLRPEGNLAALGSLVDSPDETLAAAAVAAAGLWHVDALQPRLRELALATATRDGVRAAAVDGLTLLADRASRDALEELSQVPYAAPARSQAIVALARLDAEAAARRAVELLSDAKAATDPAPLVEAFLARKNGPTLLAAALSGHALAPDVAKMALRAARTSARPDEKLIEALRSAGGLTTSAAPPSPEEIARLVADVRERGDPARGEAIFRRQEQSCLKCHAIGGAGGQVGPDLVSVGASAQVDYLVESILLPNKAVKENYHSVVVATKGGNIATGIKVRQTDKELILRDGEDREVVVPLVEIDQQGPGGSLMPVGLADALTRTELVDLVRFLSELGKVGPYSLGNARLVRTWQVLPQSPAVLERVRRDSVAAAARDDAQPWTGAYSQVSGLLPLSALPAIKAREDAPRVGLVRFQIQVTTPGQVKLLLNSPAGLTLWVDNAPVAANNELPLDLASGTHTVALAVDLEKRQEGLRIELADIAGSPARTQIVGGK